MSAHDDPLLATLNPSQQEAVTHTDGPLLIFAGAGSGKTRVLTHRIAYLIGRKGVRPRNILAVTFTNKAASEMRERLNSLIGGQSTREMWVGTFHAVCARLLRERGEAIGLPRDFVVFDDGDQIILVKECLHQLNLDDRQYPPRACLALISQAKEKLIAPESFPRQFSGVFEGVVGKIYTLYQEKLSLNRALDFDDLIMRACRLLEQREDVRAHYQDKFRYVLVDEFQDVNHAQYMLTRLLSDKHQNLCVVGDDDQSIYGWRGADVSIILAFERDYSGARTVKLEQNYRSTKNILDAAYHVVRNNRGRKDKRLWTENIRGEEISLHEAMNEQEEAVFVATTVQEEMATRQWRLSDFAVLYRTNAQSRVLEEVFINYKIPYKIIGGVKFYERREIKDMLAYLRLVHNPYDSVSLRRVINVPARGIGTGTWQKIEERAAMQSATLWDVLGDLSGIEGVRPSTRKAVQGFVTLIAYLRGKRDERSVTRILEEVIENTGYVRELEKRALDRGAGAYREHQGAFVGHAAVQATPEDRSLQAFPRADGADRRHRHPGRGDRGRDPDDFALGQGAGVPGGVPGRPRGGCLPPRALDTATARWRRNGAWPTSASRGPRRSLHPPSPPGAPSSARRRSTRCPLRARDPRRAFRIAGKGGSGPQPSAPARASWAAGPRRVLQVSPWEEAQAGAKRRHGQRPPKPATRAKAKPSR